MNETKRIRVAERMYAVPTYVEGALWDLRVYIVGSVVDVPVALSEMSTAQLVRLSEMAHAPVRS